MSLKVLSLNVNNDRRLERPGLIKEAFPQYSFAQRVKPLKELIKKCDADISILFELSSFGAKLIGPHPTYPYNLSQNSFRFMIITDLNIKVTSHPLTQNDLYHQGSWETRKGDEYFENVLGDSFEKTLLQISYNDINIYVTHLGLGQETRLKQSQKIMSLVKGDYVLCGDFNSFENGTSKTYMPQIKILNEGNEWLTQNFRCTFRGFPYDLGYLMNEQEKTDFAKVNDAFSFRVFCVRMLRKYGCEGGALDHVFIKGLTGHVENVITCDSDHSLLLTTINL